MFLQTDGFSCMLLQISLQPFYPSTWMPKWWNPLSLYLQIQDFLSILLRCTNKHLDRGALRHHGMLESRQSFRDALSASVVEKDSGDLPTRMLLGFPGRFAFCSPCYVWAFALSGAQPSASRYWRKLWYCYQWLPACKNKKCTFIVVIMKMHPQCAKI